MPHNKSFERNARLEGEIRSVLSNLLRSEVNDPRLADVTVSTIRLSADRSKARVFYSVIGDPEQEREAGDGFAAAACQGTIEVVDGMAAPIRLSVTQDQQLAVRAHFESGGGRTTIALYMRVSPGP